MKHTIPVLRPLARFAALPALLLAACSGDEGDGAANADDGGPTEVVLYCAHDEVHSRPIVRAFEEATGISVRAEYDIEAHKTVGLVRRIREEAARPRCDVFWNNEVAHTVSLGGDGLLQPYESPNAASIPAGFKDSEHRWTGFGARARVLIVNTEALGDRPLPDSMWDLVAPEWKGQVGIARPLTGTTLTHATALFVTLGEERALEYFRGVKSNQVHLVSGNGPLMRQVRDGNMVWGWTDTDDYWVAKEQGFPVTAVFPDSGPEGMGTLVIPNTVAILKDAPHPEAARRLVDYLLSVDVERTLARSRAAQIPLHAELEDMDHPLPLDELKPMEIDYERIGAEIDARFEQLKEMFIE